MRKVTKDLFTENDNETFSMSRVSWGASFVAICTASAGIILTGGTLGIAELGIALATIAAGHGAAAKLHEPSR
jgi:hypothetical protein